MRNKLIAEFQGIDVNNDGIVTRDELHQYFIDQKVSVFIIYKADPTVLTLFISLVSNYWMRKCDTKSLMRSLIKWT